EKPVLIALRLSNSHVDVEVSDPGQGIAAHRVVMRWLGLEQNAAAFARLARKLGLSRLVKAREGLRLSGTATAYDGLLWSILGQQITVVFACQLRRRLIERLGEPFGSGLYAPPTAATVAGIEPEELLPLQISRQKAT